MFPALHCFYSIGRLDPTPLLATRSCLALNDTRTTKVENFIMHDGKAKRKKKKEKWKRKIYSREKDNERWCVFANAESTPEYDRRKHAHEVDVRFNVRLPLCNLSCFYPYKFFLAFHRETRIAFGLFFFSHPKALIKSQHAVFGDSYKRI